MTTTDAAARNPGAPSRRREPFAVPQYSCGPTAEPSGAEPPTGACARVRLAASGRRVQRHGCLFRVETTRRRTAVYGHRTLNADFLAMNPNCRLSQPDPKRKYESPVRTLRKRSFARDDHRIPNPKALGPLSRTIGQLRPPIAACDHLAEISADLSDVKDHLTHG